MGEDFGAMETITKLAPAPLLVFVISAIALAAHRFIDDKYSLPLCLLIGVILYPSLLPDSAVTFNVRNPTVALGMQGLVFGFVAWLMHGRIKSYVQRKFGILCDDTRLRPALVRRRPIPIRPPVQMVSEEIDALQRACGESL